MINDTTHVHEKRCLPIEEDLESLFRQDKTTYTLWQNRERLEKEVCDLRDKLAIAIKALEEIARRPGKAEMELVPDVTSYIVEMFGYRMDSAQKALAKIRG